MFHLLKRCGSVMMILALVLSLFSFSVSASPASSQIITAATGYTSASDVEYLITNGSFYDPVAKTNVQKSVIANWGARGEDCVFLSTYATEYYTGEYTYDRLSMLSGGTQSSANKSDLYQALQELMTSTHTYYTEYDSSKNIRAFYCYTDCVSNDISQVSILYRGNIVTSTWNQGKTWNQEHVWPQSKCLSDRQVGDIMHLRPANPSENSSRGNTAYGVSSGYYDPGVSVRGDCARTVLYMYVRWGNSTYMWGSGGVIESLDILLQWMEEDPVDTWEMGRNDSVESITGVRNVFVDYPELAFLLFDEEIPTDMVTPSSACSHSSTRLQNTKSATCTTAGYTGDTVCVSCGEVIKTGSTVAATGHTAQTRDAKDATCTEPGYTGDLWCKTCGVPLSSGTEIAATGHTDANGDNACDICGTTPLNCVHGATEVKNAKDATCTAEGYTGDTYCKDCGEKIAEGQTVPMADHTPGEAVNQQAATCSQDGYSGDIFCSVCSQQISAGETIPATGAHNYGQWQTIQKATTEETGLQQRLCADCGHAETAVIPVAEAPANSAAWIWILVIALLIIGITVVVILVIRKRKKK